MAMADEEVQLVGDKAVTPNEDYSTITPMKNKDVSFSSDNFDRIASFKSPLKDFDFKKARLATGYYALKDRKEVQLCILITVIYTVGGAIGISFWDGWSIIDSMYFVVVTFTTCGYGDLYPVNDGQRLGTSFFILFGVAVIGGYTLSVIIDRVLDTIKKESKNSNERFITDFRSRSRKLSRNLTSGSSLPIEQVIKPLAGEIKEVLGDTAPFLVLMLLGAIGIGYVEGWTIITSIYYCIVTATSVGYGDIAPETRSMRLFAVIFIPFSVGLLATTFGNVTSVILTHKHAIAEREFLSRTMTETDFGIMDADDDGHVSYEEFITFMLVSMGKVDHEDMIQLKDVYHNMSKKGDSLSIHDLNKSTSSL